MRNYVIPTSAASNSGAAVHELYVGVMSGTSLDGADAILVDWKSRQTKGFASAEFEPDLRAELLGLCAPGDDELTRAGIISIRLAHVYAGLVKKLLADANVARGDVAAIGCHGQTVRHHPELGFTIQIQNPALLAELTNISVVADFRSRDIAAGGQGAPLAPAFHRGAFHSANHHRAVVNIGGISNITFLPRDGRLSGFDCGPGNVLMNGWIQRHQGLEFDRDGAWASSGTVIRDLLAQCRADPYFDMPPPKSTGRERFNLSWLDIKVQPQHSARDVQATLLELTAGGIAEALKRHFPACEEVYLCGGGADNAALVARLKGLLAGIAIGRTDALGIPAQQVEAAAFSWLAKCAVQRRAIDLADVTGARHPSILGAIYQG